MKREQNYNYRSTQNVLLVHGSSKPYKIKVGTGQMNAEFEH